MPREIFLSGICCQNKPFDFANGYLCADNANKFVCLLSSSSITTDLGGHAVMCDSKHSREAIGLAI